MFKRLSFKAKLIAISFFTSAMMVVVGAISHNSIDRIDSHYRFVVEKTLPKRQLVNEMILHYRQMQIALTTLGLADLPQKEAQASVDEVQSEENKFDKTDTEYVALGFIDGQKVRYEKLQAAWTECKAVSDKLLSLQKQSTPEAKQQMLSLFTTDVPQKATVFHAAADEILQFHNNILKTKIKDAQENSDNFKVLNWILILISVSLGFLISLFLSIKSSNELRSIATNLIENASEVSGTVSDLTASAATLLNAVENQTSSVQETAAAMEEIRSMVQRNSESTAESFELSKQSKEYVGSGQSSVQTMITAVSEITDSNKEIQQEIELSNQRISEIVSIISEIGTKTKVINEIVFQTKLLSFNASVEAARAGENGKGFAVVAEEVGNLADMSGNAAKEISALLSQSTERVNSIVQETTTRVNQLMTQASQKLKHGNEVAQTCQSVLEKIVTNTEELSQRIQNIDSASHEQASGINEIGKAINLIERSTQISSSEIANTKGSAQHLSTQAKSLGQCIYRLQTLISGKANGVGTIVNAFVWRDRYALGVSEMDDEHKILIHKINTLVTSINNGDGLSSIKELFGDLAAYTKSHFSDEEAYMRSIGYTELPQHQKIHKKLLDQVGQYGQQINSGNFSAEELVSFLNDWLIKHILGVDMQYAHFSRSEESANISAEGA